MQDKRDWKLLLFVSALLLPYFALCFFAHPIGDDFDFMDKSPGFIQMELTQYLKWSGRYASNINKYLILYPSLTLYRLTAFVAIILTLSSVYFLFTSISQNAFSRNEKLLASMLFTSLLLGLLPSISQDIYWISGFSTYRSGCVIAMFYAGFLVRYYQKQFIGSKAIHFTLCVLLLLLAIGFNEVLTFILIAIHGLIWLSLPLRQKFSSVWFVLGLLTIVFSLIMLFAPGNAVRSGYFASNHNLTNSLSMTFLQMIRFFFSWVFYAPLWIATILFIGFSNRIYESSAVSRKLTAFKWWEVFLFLWLILFISIFPAYWNTEILGQHRTLNVACAFFLPTWFLMAFIMAKKLGLNEKAEFLTAKAKNLIVILLAGLLLFSGNSGMALLEFSKGEITGFSSEMDMRNKLVKEALREGKKDVTVPPLTNQPASLFVLDLQTDCKHWINTTYAQYMGIDTVRVEQSKALMQ